MNNETNRARPLVSIIIPVYNVEKYLRQCLDSVLAQTYTNLEVILVDDGSTDLSNAICREYCEEDSRFRLYRKENGGASSARNVGLDKSTGEYLYFLDSDDEISRDAIAKMLACACDNQADLVFIEARSKREDGACSSGHYDYHRQYAPDAPYRLMEEMLDNKEFHVGMPFFFVKKPPHPLDK